MRHYKAVWVLTTALCSSWAIPAFAQAAPPTAATKTDEAASATTDIIVTARRSAEKLQDVPVAVSVITPAKLESKGSFNPVDLVQSVPGLTVTATVADRNNVSYTIRGQGYSSGTIFPAVVSYFNEIPVSRLTQGTFFDLANVQVLRGPQGVSFGRVTDGGNVMLTTQAPKNSFGGYVGVKLGNYSLRTVNGAINIPIVDDKVLFRAAFETARRDGFTANLANGQTLDDVSYEGYRGALTLRPVVGLENTTTVTYLSTHDHGTGIVFSGLNQAALGANVGPLAALFAGGYGIDGNGSVKAYAPGLTPFTAANYLASQQAQLAAQQARGPRAISQVDPTYSKRKNLYVSNVTTASLSDSVQLKNVFGYTREREDQASNYGAANGGAVLTCHSSCINSGLLFTNAEQFSEELRLSGKSIGGRLTWAVGAYADEQRPAGISENATVNVAILQRVVIDYATTKSRAVYGTAEYAITDHLKINGGLRYTHDTVYDRQTNYISPIPGGEAALKTFLTGPGGGSLPPPVADFVVASTFAPIPHGVCQDYGAASVFGPATCHVNSGAFNATTWTGGASYKTDGGQLFYAKVSKGYRPGGINSTAPVGASPAYQPETDVSVEAGIKADFHFDGVFLRTNLAAYTDRYKAIQKQVVFPGAVPVSLIQNVDNARVKGVEAEVTLVPTKGLTLGGTFAFTDAKFDKLATDTSLGAQSPCDPTAVSIVGFCSRNKFNAVPKTQFTLNAGYTLPLDSQIGEISFGAQLYRQSSVSLIDTSTLNPNFKQDAYTTIDLSANWRNVLGKPVDLSFFVSNLTDKTYRIGGEDLTQRSSLGVAGDIYAAPRMWGFALKYRFGSDAN